MKKMIVLLVVCLLTPLVSASTVGPWDLDILFQTPSWEETDKAAIEQSAKAGYEQQLQLIEARYQAQLQAKDAEIESHKRESANMLEITRLLASKPINVDASDRSSRQTNYGGTNFQNDISSGEV